MSSEVTAQQDQQQQKPRKRIEPGVMVAGAADTVKNSAAKITRTGIISLYYGSLLGVSVPASPLFYKSFKGSTGAQIRIISQFTAVGAVFSAAPYALYLDNAKPGSSSVAPQFNSIFSPLLLGVSVWIGGHLWYPGHFVLVFEQKGQRLREFARLTAKTMVALHRVHLPFVLGWSFFVGVLCRFFREKPVATAVVDAPKVQEEGTTVVSVAPEGKT